MKADERVARQVGQALRRLRLDQDFLMKQVAGRAGITISMLSLYEHGHRCPCLPNLVKILRALDLEGKRHASARSKPAPPP